MGGITVFALIYLLKGIFWWTLFSSGLLVSVHAFLRDASMHKDMDDAMTMEGDFTVGEESSFLDNTSRV
jgi:ABC-type polysaccharide/polyol phosphate export permease